jgi:cytochrome c553
VADRRLPDDARPDVYNAIAEKYPKQPDGKGVPMGNRPVFRKKLLALAVLGCWAGAGTAQPSEGEVLAAGCAQCHGTHGRAVASFPSIAGDEMYGDLLERKYRPPEGIMDYQARGFSDEQLRLISDYFASLSEGD